MESTSRAVLDEKFAAALKCTKREGNTLSVTIRSAFDDGNFRQLIKNNATKATGAHIGIVSHITLAELHRLLDETEALNGFANRFLWICSRRQKLVPLPEPMPTYELAKIKKELLRIFQAGQSVDQIRVNPQAKELWSSIYAELSSECPGLIGCVVNRAESMVLRLAMIYCLLDAKDTITPDHLDSALGIWAYAKQSAEYIFSGREVNPIAQKILDAVERAPVSMTDIHGLLSNHGSRRQMQTAIQELVGARKIEVIEEKTFGRSKKIIRLAKKAKEAK